MPVSTEEASVEYLTSWLYIMLLRQLLHTVTDISQMNKITSFPVLFSWTIFGLLRFASVHDTSNKLGD